MSLPSVLIVCSAFPPMNATGARRPYMLARHLANNGHRVSVITTATTINDQWDADLDGITVYRYPQGGMQDVRGPLRSLLARKVGFASDSPPGVIARTLAFFLLPLEFATRSYVRTTEVDRNIERPDVIIASGPGWSTFEIGQRLARHWDSTFLVDYRDPWTVNNDKIALHTTTWYGSGVVGTLKRAWMRRLERRYTRHAYGGTVATGPFMENASLTFGDIPIRAVLNGTNAPRSIPLNLPNGPFTVVHTGRLYHEQDWQGVANVLYRSHADGVGTADLEVILLGAVSEDEAMMDILRRCAADTGLLCIETRVGPIEMYSWIDRADILLHLGFKGKNGILPLKFLEYLSTGRPILQFSAERTEVEEILEQTRTGILVSTEAHLTETLQRAIRLKKEGKALPYAPDLKAITELGWEKRMEEWRTFILELHAKRRAEKHER